MPVVNWLRRYAVVILTVLLSSCASQKVDWDYNTEHSLAGMITYRWIEPTQESQKLGYQFEALMDHRVHNAVDDALKARGFQRVDDDNAEVDFLINYIASQKPKKKERLVTTSFDYGFNPWGLGISTDSRIQEHEESSLLIDIIDPKTKQVVWRGRSRVRTQKDLSPEQRTIRINVAVAKILEGFPRPKR